MGRRLALRADVRSVSRTTRGTSPPVQVALPTAAPRSRRPYLEAFGTQRVDFGATVASITFGAADLDAPMAAADPRLAGNLRWHARLAPVPAAGHLPRDLPAGARRDDRVRRSVTS